MENLTTIDSICDGTPYHSNLEGQGIITMIQRCQIQLDDQVIQSVYETRSSISRSYLPSLNMSQRIEHLNNKTLKLQAISADLEIDELKGKFSTKVLNRRQKYRQVL